MFLSLLLLFLNACSTIYIDDDNVAEACQRIKKSYEENQFEDEPPIKVLLCRNVRTSGQGRFLAAEMRRSA
jgi:hypothetical protein